MRLEDLRGFTLIELLVAVAVFGALAAAAYGGLAGIARTSTALTAEQDRFAEVTRTVSTLDRDLRQAVSRSVDGNDGNVVPALIGATDSIEWTRLGFANPQAEARSNLQRVVCSLDDHTLRYGQFAVLDRAADSAPTMRAMLGDVSEFHVRYLGRDGNWRDSWPPADTVAGDPTGIGQATTLPRAIEFRLVLGDYGEIRRTVELPAQLPADATGTVPPDGNQPTPGASVPTIPSGGSR